MTELVRDESMRRIREISEKYRRNNAKKFKTKSDITFVGIHHRRGDHLALQRQVVSSTVTSVHTLTNLSRAGTDL